MPLKGAYSEGELVKRIARAEIKIDQLRAENERLLLALDSVLATHQNSESETERVRKEIWGEDPPSQGRAMAEGYTYECPVCSICNLNEAEANERSENCFDTHCGLGMDCGAVQLQRRQQ